MKGKEKERKGKEEGCVEAQGTTYMPPATAFTTFIPSFTITFAGRFRSGLSIPIPTCPSTFWPCRERRREQEEGECEQM